MKRLVLFFFAIAAIMSLGASSLIDVTKPGITADAPASTPDRVQTTVVVCGDNPDGVTDCVKKIYDDGMDCLIIDTDDHASPDVYGPDC